MGKERKQADCDHVCVVYGGHARPVYIEFIFIFITRSRVFGEFLTRG